MLEVHSPTARDRDLVITARESVHPTKVSNSHFQFLYLVGSTSKMSHTDIKKMIYMLLKDSENDHIYQGCVLKLAGLEAAYK